MEELVFAYDHIIEERMFHKDIEGARHWLGALEEKVRQHYHQMGTGFIGVYYTAGNLMESIGDIQGTVSQSHLCWKPQHAWATPTIKPGHILNLARHALILGDLQTAALHVEAARALTTIAGDESDTGRDISWQSQLPYAEAMAGSD